MTWCDNRVVNRLWLCKTSLEEREEEVRGKYSSPSVLRTCTSVIRVRGGITRLKNTFIISQNHITTHPSVSLRGSNRWLTTSVVVSCLPADIDVLFIGVLHVVDIQKTLWHRCMLQGWSSHSSFHRRYSSAQFHCCLSLVLLFQHTFSSKIA